MHPSRPQSVVVNDGTRRWTTEALASLTILLLVILGASVGGSAASGPTLGIGSPHAAAPQTIAAGGSDFMCGVRSDLTLSCWGRSNVELTAPPDGRYAVVAAGRRDVCALAIDSSMVCWGRWYAGDAPLGEPVVAPAGRFLALDVADTHACAIRTDQSLVCWGAQQGERPAPVATVPSGQFLAVAAVHDRAGGCAIRIDGTITCWGPDTWGEATPPSGTFRALDSGRQMYCADPRGRDRRREPRLLGSTAIRDGRPSAGPLHDLGHRRRHRLRDRRGQDGDMLGRSHRHLPVAPRTNRIGERRRDHRSNHRGDGRDRSMGRDRVLAGVGVRRPRSDRPLRDSPPAAGPS